MAQELLRGVDMPISGSMRSRVLVLVGITLGMFGCGSRHNEDLGSIGMALQLAPGLTLDSVGYSITGPGSFSRTGSIDVSNSTTISATIGGLPMGDGYTLTLSSTASNGKTQCAGTSAPFSIMAHATTSVNVHLLCQEAPAKGSVMVNGTVNICPAIDGLSASPSEALVGGSIALAATA